MLGWNVVHPCSVMLPGIPGMPSSRFLLLDPSLLDCIAAIPLFNNQAF
jgi:hypothetical protein